MAKRINCTYCGTLIRKKETSCLSCGAPNVKPIKRKYKQEEPEEDGSIEYVEYEPTPNGDRKFGLMATLFFFGALFVLFITEGTGGFLAGVLVMLSILFFIL